MKRLAGLALTALSIFVLVASLAGSPERQGGRLEGEVLPTVSDGCEVDTTEGTPVVLDAACAVGPGSVDSVYRWDWEGDGLWDMPWANSSELVHVWGDDLRGQARVVRGERGERTELNWEARWHARGGVTETDWVAQSFVPSSTITVTRVKVAVAVNWGTPQDLNVWIRDGLNASDANLSHGQISYTEVPRAIVYDPSVWPIVDVDDVSLEPGRTYYVMLTVPVASGSLIGAYESYGVGLVRPEWPEYGGNFTYGWVRDPDDNLGMRIYVEDVVTVAEGAIDVAVDNIAPSIDSGIRVTAMLDATLRVAGEKWHDVTLTLYTGDVALTTATIVRRPGSPADQAVTFDRTRVGLTDRVSSVAIYTPSDDRLNGQEWGATPAWLILTGVDGSEVHLEHTFNAQQPDTWTWTVDDLRPRLLGLPIEFEASASDPGSDDLTFEWDFGDGGSLSETVFNNGVGPDPYPSPDVNPIEATVHASHAYVAQGSYIVRLLVEDDDGGRSSVELLIHL